MNPLIQLTGVWHIDDPQEFTTFQGKVIGSGYLFASSSSSTTIATISSLSSTLRPPTGRRPSLINSLLSTLSPFTLRISLSSPYQYRFELYHDKECRQPLHRYRDYLLDNTEHDHSPPTPLALTNDTLSLTSSSTVSTLYRTLSYITSDKIGSTESSSTVPSLSSSSSPSDTTKSTFSLHVQTKFQENGNQYQCTETYTLSDYHQLEYKVTYSTVENTDNNLPLSYSGTWKRIENARDLTAYRYTQEFFRNYPSFSSSVSSSLSNEPQNDTTITTSSLPSSSISPPSLPPPPLPSEPVWFIPDFSGSWAVDHTVSDSMDPMLTLMGIPWLVKKIALGMEIITVIEHNISIKEVKTTEKASAGVLNTNDMIADGIMVEKTGKDGKIAKVTCKIYEPSKEDIQQYKALGCMQIITVFPDGGGTSDNIWTLIDEGKKMKQKITFTRGEKAVIIHRMLMNKEWKPQPPPPTPSPVPTPAPIITTTPTVPSSTTNLHISVNSTEASKALLPASPITTPASVPSSSSSSSSTSRSLHHLPSWIATEWERDPFFIPLSGKWIVDQARSQSLDPLWKSMGISSFARFLVKNVEIISRISHSKFLFMSQDKSTLGLHKVVIPLDGQWRPIKQADGRWMLCRGTHTHGSGDKGPTWLGYEAGMIPPVLLRAGHVLPSSAHTLSEQHQQRKSSLAAAAVAAAAIAGGESAYFPYYSSLPFDTNKYTTSSVTIETLLMDVTEIVQTLQQQSPTNSSNDTNNGSTSKGKEESKGKGVRPKHVTGGTNRLVPSTTLATDSSDSDSLTSSSRRTSNASDILNTDIAYQINANTVNNKTILTGSTSPPNRKLSPAVTAAINSGMPLWQALPYTNTLPRSARLIVVHKLENRNTLIQQYTHIAGTDNQNHDIVLSKVERSLILQEDDAVIMNENIRNDRTRMQHARAIILSRRGEADKLRKQILIADAERVADEAAEGVLDKETDVNEKTIINGKDTTTTTNLTDDAGSNSTGSNSSNHNKETSIAANPWSAIPDHDGTTEEEHVEYDGTNGCQIM